MQGTISFPDVDVSPISRTASGVAGLRILLVNVYGVTSPEGGWFLIDAGLYFAAGRIRRWAKENFGSRPPRGILLTHGHFDHVGSLKDLAEAWDVPVFAHPLEMPYLTGRSKYPPPDPFVGGGAMAWMSGLYPRGPVDLGTRLRALPAGGAIDGLPGWRWIHTPGHTAGHVSFFEEDSRVLVAGDAVTTTKQESLRAVIAQRPELHGPPAYYTSDWEAAKLSVGRLAGLSPNVIASGHGRPVVGPDAAAALQDLADRFDEWERPSTGRYIAQPAVTDERGIVAVPPPVVPRAAKIGIAAGLGAGIAYGIWRRRRVA